MGAWIEISPWDFLYAFLARVAPHVGAWIEIEYEYRITYTRNAVAPHVGAWIEIGTALLSQTLSALSLPMWERGLKSPYIDRKEVLMMSLPMWERGLK